MGEDRNGGPPAGPPPEASAPELYHRIGEPDSAEARRRAAALGVMGRLALRNVHFESHAAALRARGGSRTPALWDGTALHQGREAVIEALEAMAGARAP